MNALAAMTIHHQRLSMLTNHQEEFVEATHGRLIKAMPPSNRHTRQEFAGEEAGQSRVHAYASKARHGAVTKRSSGTTARKCASAHAS
ncbi:MAG: hypothetical protein Q7T70_13080 [Polaromonas sp.]|nr:hypothetical protein [Polaromonas sp.]